MSPDCFRNDSWQDYLRAPRWGFFTRDWRSFMRLRLGLLMRNVPLPT
jgi:hypothetical protein